MKRIGAVVYATEQGLGYLAKSFSDAGVIHEVMIWQHPRPGGLESYAKTHTEWYPEGTPVLAKQPFMSPRQTFDVAKFVSKIDVLLCFETPFDWTFPNFCRQHGVKTVLVPMHEWTLKETPHRFDKVIAPSLLDQRYFPGSEFIPVPVDVPWRQRNKANRFLHNAGHVGHRGHKGTLELLQAMKLVTRPIDLTVRCQDWDKLLKMMTNVFGAPVIPSCLELSNGGRIRFEMGVSKDKLFTGDHDVYVAPEKFNGMSLPLQEAFASGMAVVTTDRFPMNTWLPKPPLIPVKETRIVSMGSGYLDFEESIVDPVDIARTLDGIHEQPIAHLSSAGLEYAHENSWNSLKDRWVKALEEA